MSRKKILPVIIISIMSLAALCGCNTKHEINVAPVEIKPIHITIDVNIKVDRALDDFFGDLDAASETKENTGTATAPSAK